MKDINMSTYLQDGWDVYGIEIKSWNQVEKGMLAYAIGIAGVAVLAAIYLLKRYPTVSPTSIIGGLVLAALLLAPVMSVILRLSTLTLAVYGLRKAKGFSYCPQGKCDSLKDWVYFSWRHEVKLPGEALADRKTHYGKRIFGWEILIVGTGGWHPSNTLGARPYHCSY